MSDIKLFHILTIVFVIAIAVVLLKSDWLMSTKTNLLSEDEGVFLSTEVNLSYADFLHNLESECPYYEPNGARYRECLVSLLKQRESELSAYQERLIRDLESNTEPEFLAIRQSLVLDLRSLSKLWPPYRDQLCITIFNTSAGGSNQAGFINTCRLYETARQLELLLKLRADWIL